MPFCSPEHFRHLWGRNNWALVPPLHRRIGTTAWVTSIVAIPATLAAKSSGEYFLTSMGFSEENPGPYADHVLYADITTVAAIATGAVAVGLAYLLRKGRAGALTWVARIIAAGLAVVLLVSSILAGHEGARLTWVDDAAASPASGNTGAGADVVNGGANN